MNLSAIQTEDYGRVFALQRTINQRQKQKQPVDQLQNKLARLIEASSSKTGLIQQNIGSISLQADLPIAAKAEEIIGLLAKHQVIIVAGETGCGKTTQLPKICLQAGLGTRGLIGHTQPRRVAATSVARRIAEELNTELGAKVGYAIRFNSKVSEQTRLKLMTDGVLLAEIESDPLLSRYEVIIIDEAHERSLNIDFLLGFIQHILTKRKDLKVIITSATIDPQRFSENFNNAPVVLVEGRSYPVEVRYRPLSDDPQDNGQDQLLVAITNAVDECSGESRGNILIFADGEGEIKTITKELNKHHWDNTVILPLYSRLSIKDQQKIFATSSQRKIIVSTNVAETSLTVPGIIFVIDIGTARISRFSQRSKIQQLPVEKISRASADQRKGRCGRIAPGICIRLYSEEDFLLRDAFTVPEIKRTNLSSVALRLKAMKVKQVENFPFMEPPEERVWNVAFNSLFELGALDSHKEITRIGVQMAQLPVDPQLARILVEPSLTAVNEMLIFCSLMSVREVRERPHDRQQKADQLHQKYNQTDSDVLTAIKLWEVLQQQKKELSSNGFRRWCQDNLINFLGWLEWRQVYFQLKEAVENLSIKINSSPVAGDEVHRALIPGFITHILLKSQEAHYQGVRGLKVWLHPSSLLFKKTQSWLLSAEMIETEKLYARMNAPVKPEWIEQAAPHLLKRTYRDIHWRKNKGQVMASLNLTLFGLPIVNNRLVNYSEVDPLLARKLFLNEGLAQDQLSEDFPFIKSNREKLKQLEEQEQRQRLNNLRLDNQSLADLYDSVVPAHIVNLTSLKRWIKKDFKTNNRLLTFSQEQLTQNNSIKIEDFPSQINVKGFELNLSYCFAPGTSDDGVTVEIPNNMLKQFNERDFDWLVPGYLEEKILATIKVLPKPIRRSLIPLAETAQECYQRLLLADSHEKPFIEALASEVQLLSGMQIEPKDFDLQALPPHLTMKYRVAGRTKGAPVSSMLQLKNEVAPQKSNSKSITKQNFCVWPGGHFEIEKILTRGDAVSRIFQALTDQSGQVVLQEFSSQQVAERVHLQGVARLLTIIYQNDLNKFFNGWPDKKQLDRLCIRVGGFKPLADVLALRVATHFVEPHHPILEEQQFDNVSHQFKQNFRAMLAQELEMFTPLLKQRETIFLQMSGLNQTALDISLKDIREQLHVLWLPAALIQTGDLLAENYKRYQTAIEARLKRITTNYPKEEQALGVWLAWHEWWQDFAKFSGNDEVAEHYWALFWTLEEFRISLFSPGVKTLGGVSAKKLQSRFEQFEELVQSR